jgi:hypothetical protein
MKSNGSIKPLARLAAPFGVVALCGAAFGCVIIADIDETRMAQGAGGSSSSSASTSSSSASSSTGSGAFVCLADGDCPGATNECGKPRCFSDGLCGFDNEPIGAPCTENGGHACDGKGQCVECTANVHCASGKCGPDRLCIPPTCNDEIKNGNESDIDCGGSCPARCGPLEGCMSHGDCVSAACEAGTCAPSCSDQIINENETDTDCGGLDCAPCGLGRICNIAQDCSSGLCEAGICVPVPTCTDNVANGAETDIDCGGPDCVPCPAGHPCLVNNDCTSHSCVQGICATATCSDGIQNGNEIAIDCGASCPTGCPTGTPCMMAEECASKKCEGPIGNKVCGEPSCFDGIWNGDEAAWDCGGSCTVKCPPLYPCRIHEDCRGGICDPVTMTCAPTCNDGYPNQGETDPDCGGPCPMKCPEGWHCLTDDDCVTGLYCTLGHCLP